MRMATMTTEQNERVVSGTSLEIFNVRQQLDATRVLQLQVFYLNHLTCKKLAIYSGISAQNLIKKVK